MNYTTFKAACDLMGLDLICDSCGETTKHIHICAIDGELCNCCDREFCCAHCISDAFKYDYISYEEALVCLKHDLNYPFSKEERAILKRELEKLNR